MNGAVHGEAMRPPRESPTAPHRRRDSLPSIRRQRTEPASVNSNTPERLSASTKNRIARPTTTAGDCSWKPHPSCSPAARRMSSSPASTTNVATTPGGERDALQAMDAGVANGPCASASAFSESTGNTHGIRLRIRPPTKASSNAATSEISAPAEAGAGAERSTAGTWASEDLAPACDCPDQRHVDGHGGNALAALDEALARRDDTGDALEFGRQLSRGRQRQACRAPFASRVLRLLARRFDAAFLMREELQRTRIRGAFRAATMSTQLAHRRLAQRPAIPAAARGVPRASRRWRFPTADRDPSGPPRAARGRGPHLPVCKRPCRRASRHAPSACRSFQGARRAAP